MSRPAERRRLTVAALTVAAVALAAGLATAACAGPAPAPPNAPAPNAPNAPNAPAPNAPNAPGSSGEAGWLPAPVVPLDGQPLPRLVVDAPLPDQLAKGLVVLRYRAENLRIVPVYGPNALDVSPRIGHIHVAVDDAPWHWADASGEPLIIQWLPPGPHKVWIGLADPTHKVMDSRTVEFVIPPGQGGGGHH